MRLKISAGILVALALMIPAAPAAAHTEQPGLDNACQTVERKVYKDIRKLVTIDLDTATNVEVRVLAAQILSAALADSLPVLPDALQDQLDGTPEELRAFLKTDWQKAWSTALRVSVVRTLTDAGTNVKAAAQKALDAGGIDTYLTYLNDGLYVARELDCKAQPTSTPSATTSASPSPTSSSSSGTPGTSTAGSAAPGGEGGGLPVTGAGTATVAAIGVAILLLGGAGYLLGRRRRSRFVA